MELFNYLNMRIPQIKPSRIAIVLFLFGILLFGLQVLEDYNLPPFSQRVFAGHYLLYFEISSFVPCGYSSSPGYGWGYWFESDEKKGRALFEQMRPYVSYEQDSMRGILEVHIRFIGSLAKPAGAMYPPSSFPVDSYRDGYGHLNQYMNQVTVTEILEVGPQNPMRQLSIEAITLITAFVVGLGAIILCFRISKITFKTVILKELQLFLIYSVAFIETV